MTMSNFPKLIYKSKAVRNNESTVGFVSWNSKFEWKISNNIFKLQLLKQCRTHTKKKKGKADKLKTIEFESRNISK